MRQRFAIILLFAAILGMGACGGSTRDVKVPATDTSPAIGSPDNNSANNPSLADTAYEKNRTRPITDTMKKK